MGTLVRRVKEPPNFHSAADKTAPNSHGGIPMLVLSRKSQESVVVGGSNGFERILTYVAQFQKSFRDFPAFPAGDLRKTRGFA